MIADTEESLKVNHDDQVESTTTRAEENRAYQTDIKNIVVAEELLTKAIDVLKAYYKQFESELQGDIVADAPDTWEGEYKGQSEQGADVIKTLEFIKDETHKEQTEAHQAENDAQHEFEDNMADLKEEQATLEESLAKYQ